MVTATHLAFLASLVVAPSSAALTWSSCGTGLDCATLSVPLEYDASGKAVGSSKASVPLARYKATVSSSQRKGSILVNPGGPGGSGKSFITSGAGAAISTLTGGYYDIVGWDPRGVGESEPRMVCFDTAGEEYDFVNSLPSAANTTLGQIKKTSAASTIASAVKVVDDAYAKLAVACDAKNSTAYFTSTAAHVVRDMAAIVDEVDGSGKPLNYWGFSYGTIFGAEFIQAFPERIGQVVLDGVFDADANIKTYDVQLPNDQVSINDAIKDFAQLCVAAGSDGCALASGSSTADDLVNRIYQLHEDLYANPISGVIGSDALSAFLWNFFLVPTTWPLIAAAVAGLEKRDSTTFAAVVSGSATAEPSNRSAPATGDRTLLLPILNCMDNADTTGLTLDSATSTFKTVSVNQNTPWLNADLNAMLYCRHGPSTRPSLKNLGHTKLSAADKTLSTNKKTVLIINPEHDTNTPLTAAEKLHKALPNSSKLAIRRGTGHTTVSIASLGIAKAVNAFFVDGTVPSVDGQTHEISQLIFDKSIPANTATPASVWNGTFTDAEKTLLTATHSILLAFLAIA